MKILVCVKQVPHKDARLEISSDETWIQDESIKFEINAYDTYALEEALRIKDAGEAEVVILSIGPDRAIQALRGLPRHAEAAVVERRCNVFAGASHQRELEIVNAAGSVHHERGGETALEEIDHDG